MATLNSAPTLVVIVSYQSGTTNQNPPAASADLFYHAA
jgi:hypothetical protein